MVENDPGEKVDEGGIGGEERRDHRAVQHLEGRDIEVVGQDREKAEAQALNTDHL